MSAGTNALFRLGATPVTCLEDVLEAYGIEHAAVTAVSLGPTAESILARLGDGALTGDEVVRASGVDAGVGAAALVELELAGRVTLEDGVYRVAV